MRLPFMTKKECNRIKAPIDPKVEKAKNNLAATANHARRGADRVNTLFEKKNVRLNILVQ